MHGYLYAVDHINLFTKTDDPESKIVVDSNDREIQFGTYFVNRNDYGFQKCKTGIKQNKENKADKRQRLLQNLKSTR